MNPTEAHLKRAREFWRAQSPSLATIAQLIADVEEAAGERCAVAALVATGRTDSTARAIVQKVRGREEAVLADELSIESEQIAARVVLAARGR